jgi:hypothetical protein
MSVKSSAAPAEMLRVYVHEHAEATLTCVTAGRYCWRAGLKLQTDMDTKSHISIGEVEIG